MAGFDFAEGIRKAFLAGVGAVALGAEKSQELIEDFIAKGEITVEQGKALNEELAHKVKEVVDDAPEAVLRARLSAMTPEERAAWLERAAKVSADLDAKAAESASDESAEPVDAEVEEVAAEDDAE